jgi:putative transposase
MGYPLEGYRRLAYMMLDADIVAVSPSSVYRVLKAAGKLTPSAASSMAAAGSSSTGNSARA